MRITFNTDPMLTASFHVPDFDDWVAVPVLGWDEFGRAVVATPAGVAEPAAKLPGFIELTTLAEGQFSTRLFTYMPEKHATGQRREKRIKEVMAGMDGRDHIDK